MGYRTASGGYLRILAVAACIATMATTTVGIPSAFALAQPQALECADPVQSAAAAEPSDPTSVDPREDGVDLGEEAAYEQWVAANPSAGTAAADVDIIVYWHNFHQGPAGLLTRSQVDGQMAWLNRAYSGGQEGTPSRFNFVFGGLENVQKADASVNLDSDRADNLKREYRTGGRQKLNFFVAGQLVDNAGNEWNGWATYPWAVDSSLAVDGIWLTRDYIRGVSGDNNQRHGDTAVHEVGHWLGLYHVFEGFCNGPGDGVADTGRMSEGSANNPDCSGERDTCRDDGGLNDPIHNFMSYSWDDCRNRFTPGQVDRMSNMWDLHRA